MKYMLHIPRTRNLKGWNLVTEHAIYSTNAFCTNAHSRSIWRYSFSFKDIRRIQWSHNWNRLMKPLEGFQFDTYSSFWLDILSRRAVPDLFWTSTGNFDDWIFCLTPKMLGKNTVSEILSHTLHQHAKSYSLEFCIINFLSDFWCQLFHLQHAV